MQEPMPTDHHFVDRTGMTYGALTVIEYAYKKGRETYWLCKCECGNTNVVSRGALTSGNTTTCGCSRRRQSGAHVTGDKKAVHAWCGMISRCTKSNAINYSNYGGRGIKVCERWQGINGLPTFLADMGPRPEGYTLDRIDTNGDYAPYNCKWSSVKDQARNKNNNLLISLNGRTQCLSAWVEELGIPNSTIRNRLLNGCTPEEALTMNKLPKPNEINITYNGKTQCLAAWARELGIPEPTMRSRLNNGWSTERLLTVGNLRHVKP